MRKIGFMKYKENIKEVLPKTYKVKKITCQRKMFCTMINQYLSTKSQFDLRNELTFRSSLLHIFEEKIVSFFQFYKLRPEKAQKIVKVFAHESLLINQYFKQSKNKKLQYLSKNIHFKQNFKLLYGYEHPATELIQLIFNGKEVQMMLDLDEIFTLTIFNRIKKEKDKKVTLEKDHINIEQNGVVTRLQAKWKRINPNMLQKQYRDVDKAIEKLQKEEIDQWYFVYPKTDNFKRHIEIKSESSKQLKMIPYSFTFIHRGAGKCKK